MNSSPSRITFINRNTFLLILAIITVVQACYTFQDISIPENVKTARVNNIINKATYVNPQLAPRLMERLKLKINNQTRLQQISGDSAHYEISGIITEYRVTTTGISNQQSSINRLTVTVRITFKNRLDPSTDFEADISRNLDCDPN